MDLLRLLDPSREAETEAQVMERGGEEESGEVFALLH